MHACGMAAPDTVLVGAFDFQGIVARIQVRIGGPVVCIIFDQDPLVVKTPEPVGISDPGRMPVAEGHKGQGKITGSIRKCKMRGPGCRLL